MKSLLIFHPDVLLSSPERLHASFWWSRMMINYPSSCLAFWFVWHWAQPRAYGNWFQHTRSPLASPAAVIVTHLEQSEKRRRIVSSQQDIYQKPSNPTTIVTYKLYYNLLFTTNNGWNLCRQYFDLREVKCESGSSVSIVSGYGLDDRAIEVRSLAEADFSFSLCGQTGSGPHPAPCTMGIWGNFRGAKAWSGLDVDHSPPSSAAVQNEELYLISLKPFVACSGTALREVKWQESGYD
jgi:hypothetical protein